jgi:hypothetical protein
MNIDNQVLEAEREALFAEISRYYAKGRGLELVHTHPISRQRSYTSGVIANFSLQQGQLEMESGKKIALNDIICIGGRGSDKPLSC